MACQIHQGDIGTRFIFTIQDCDGIVDLSNALNINILFKSPDDEISTKIGAVLTDGTDGKVYYDTVEGDLDQAGIWKVQAKVSFATGLFSTDIHTFKVHCNLD